MEVFSTRQPIFDRDKKVYGYELLFRCGFEDYYNCLGAQRDSLDLMAFVNFGEFADGKKGLATFTRNLLLRDLPTVLPKEMVLVGIPAEIVVDQEVVVACERLAAAEYELVLDDLACDGLDSPLVGLASIVRVDFSRTPPGQGREICRRLAHRGIVALAKKVDSTDQFDRALEAGFGYFQGSFFRKPVISDSDELAGNELSYARLLCEVNRPELSLGELASIIRGDPLMTYHLLKFINSAWFGVRCVVNSVQHALVLIGPKETRRWASMLVIRNLGQGKPPELLLRSLIRAKVAETVAPLAGMRQHTPELFLLGLFSSIDAMLDRPLDQLLKNLPIDEKITTALLGQSGPFRNVLDLILCYEDGDWDSLASCAKRLGLDEQALPPQFKQATKWANKTLGLLEETEIAKAPTA
jgi:EAL and modified HD-GYP domain-containing signal transduction protein